MSDVSAHTRSTQGALGQRTTGSRWFFPAASAAILAVVLVAFARTFYLRRLFDLPPMPGYLYLHGLVLTTWFVLVFLQTCLVAAHRTDLHRRLGVVAALDAALVVLVSPLVAVRAITRYQAAGVHPAEIQFIVIGDLVCLLVFSTLVVAALRMRRRPDWHKRLMLVSCVAILGPAVARLERVGLAVPVPAVLLLLLALLAAHDAVGSRRLHPATVWGSLALVIALGAILLVVGTAPAQAFIDALR